MATNANFWSYVSATLISCFALCEHGAAELTRPYQTVDRHARFYEANADAITRHASDEKCRVIVSFVVGIIAFPCPCSTPLKLKLPPESKLSTVKCFCGAAYQPVRGFHLASKIKRKLWHVANSLLTGTFQALRCRIRRDDVGNAVTPQRFATGMHLREYRRQRHCGPC